MKHRYVFVPHPTPKKWSTGKPIRRFKDVLAKIECYKASKRFPKIKHFSIEKLSVTSNGVQFDSMAMYRVNGRFPYDIKRVL